MKPILLALAIGTCAVPVSLAVPASADTVMQDVCDRQARTSSGYSGNRLPALEIGPFTARITGSVAFGVTRSSRDELIDVPQGAGAYAREQREEEKAQAYDRAYQRCLTNR